MANYANRRKLEPSPLAHEKALTRLKQSKIHGIGLFAIRKILKGVEIFPDVNDEIIWVDASKIKTFRGQVRRLYDYYCVIKSNKYGCPKSFNSLTPSWYINHSSVPNLYVDKGYRVYTLRNIDEGEELTLDYTTFMDIKIPRSWH
jgi:SET domain-containing protein